MSYAFSFFLTFLLLSPVVALAYEYRIPVDRDVILQYDPDVEREKIRAYENRTRTLKEAQEARAEQLAEERRAKAYDQAKKERRAKVRRLRGY